MSEKLINLFSSLRLTLLVLFLLAGLAIFGTGAPELPGHYETYYQSAWYRFLLALLALNLAFCTWKTIRRNLADRQRLVAQLARQGADGLPLAGADLQTYADALQASGFKVERQQEGLVARAGVIGRWGSTLVHLSVLLIMAGAILGGTGFVGTLNTYAGTVNQRYHDWKVQRELPLDFALRADAIRIEYYPITLRFQLRDPRTGQSFGEVQLKVGDSFSVPGTSLSGLARQFDPDRRVLEVEVLRQGQPVGLYRVTAEGGEFGEREHPGFEIAEVEFRDPQQRQIETDISILENGQLARQATIRVGQPFSYRGVAIYQIAYQYHPAGRWSIGFQLSKDPGEPLVWIGAVLLVSGLLAAFMIPYRALGVSVDAGGQLQLLPLAGFAGGTGQIRLQQLLGQLNS